jgi:peptidyl-prolyl cis-trans isomerase SurA
MLSSGLPDNADVRAHLLPQILRSLIDEQLQAQEAKRLDLSVSKGEVDSKRWGASRRTINIQGDIRDFIAAHGGSSHALASQMRNTVTVEQGRAARIAPARSKSATMKSTP